MEFLQKSERQGFIFTLPPPCLEACTFELQITLVVCDNLRSASKQIPVLPDQIGPSNVQSCTFTNACVLGTDPHVLGQCERFFMIQAIQGRNLLCCPFPVLPYVPPKPNMEVTFVLVGPSSPVLTYIHVPFKHPQPIYVSPSERALLELIISSHLFYNYWLYVSDTVWAPEIIAGQEKFSPFLHEA